MSRKLTVLKKLRDDEETLYRLYDSLLEVDKKVFVSERFDECATEMLSILTTEISKLQNSIGKVEEEVIQEMRNVSSI